MNPNAKLATKVGAGVLALTIPVVAYFEGTVFRTYRDPIGIATSCTGHTGPELRMGQVWTKAQCDEQLRVDIDKHAAAVGCIKRQVPDHVQAAVLSFAFNVGNAAACGSTLMRKLNEGDIAGACAELSRWVMAGGRELAGLVKRRAAERALCEGRIDDFRLAIR